MSVSLAMYDMEPAYVTTSSLKERGYPSFAGAHADAVSRSVLKSGLGHKSLMQAGPFPALEPVPTGAYGQSIYDEYQHCGPAGWWHDSMPGDAIEDGSWPLTGNWFWPSAQGAAPCSSSCSWPKPPPGLAHMMHGSCSDFDSDLDKEYDCTALSVALAGLPTDGEPVERLFSGASTACTTSGDSEELTSHTKSREPPSKVQMLVQSEDSEKGAVTVVWTVDAKKLKGSDRIAVSPPFEVACVSRRFKMMLCPRSIPDKKGGACFKKAGGRGFVQLKCETGETAAGLGTVCINISVGPGRADSAWQSPLKEPVHHDFDECGVCSFGAKSEAAPPDSADKDDWNFLQAVNEASQTFAVRLELQALPATV